MPKFNRSAFSWERLIICASIIIIDQWSKMWAIHHLHIGESIPLLAGIVLHLTYNTGIGFGLMANHSPITILMASISIASIGINSIIRQPHNTRKTGNSSLRRLGVACMLGGGVSNLYDRVTLGAVVDFISFHFVNIKTPVFNVADICVSLGGLLLIMCQPKLSRRLLRNKLLP